MKLPLLFLILLLIPLCAGEEISVEILENNIGEYYILYNDDLISCNETICTLEIANITTESNVTTTLSNAQMKKIANYVVTNIEIPKQQNLTCANESFLISTVGGAREDTTDNLRSFIMSTLVPTTAELNELKSKLTESERITAILESDVKSSNAIIEAYNLSLTSVKKENDRFEFIVIIETFAILFLLLTCTANGKEFVNGILERRRNK